MKKETQQKLEQNDKDYKKCFLCGEAKQSVVNNRIDNKPIYAVSCENCGKYKITDVFLQATKPQGMTREQKQAVTWFIKDHPNALISGENIEHIEQEYKRYMQNNR